MASPDNLTTYEPWSFRQTFADSWISEAYARDSDTLTRALQQTLCGDAFGETTSISPFYNSIKPENLSVQTPSGSGSELEIPTPKRRGGGAQAGGVVGGRIAKRKSRASKRATTTFITADPANFRQMVQQVTGVRFSCGQIPVNPVMKPEPQRAYKLVQGCLPTLDTSASHLLENPYYQSSSPASQPSTAVTTPASIGDGGFDFESFSSFPTLESCTSWN
jgi:hypothetical protein